MGQEWSALTEVLYVVWTPSEQRPLDPSVWTLMRTGTLRARFSKTHCGKRGKNYEALQHLAGCHIAQLSGVLQGDNTLVHAELMTDLWKSPSTNT